MVVRAYNSRLPSLTYPVERTATIPPPEPASRIGLQRRTSTTSISMLAPCWSAQRLSQDRTDSSRFLRLGCMYGVQSIRTNIILNRPHRSCYPVKTYGRMVKRSKQAVDRVMNARYSMTYHAWEVFKPLNCNDDLMESSQVLALSVRRYRQRCVLPFIQSDNWGSNGYLPPYFQHQTPATPATPPSPPHNSSHPPPSIERNLPKHQNANQIPRFPSTKIGNLILKKAIQIPSN